MAQEKEVKTSYFRIKSIAETDHKTKKHCLGEIAVHLNAYEDIFSDFDPRPFSERALSDDFILELRKASKVKGNEPLHLAFIMEEDKRNMREESLIKNRIAEYAKKHLAQAKKDIKLMRTRNIVYIAIGVSLTLGATYLVTHLAGNFLRNLLFVILEPAGWFFTWTGVERLVEMDHDLKEHVNFYQKLAQAETTFQSYQ